MKKLVLILLFFAYGCNRSTIIDGTFTTALSGDSIVVETANGPQGLILFGADAPESTQKYHYRSTESLIEKLSDKQIHAEIIGSPRGRFPSAWIWIETPEHIEQRSERNSLNYSQISEGSGQWPTSGTFPSPWCGRSSW